MALQQDKDYPAEIIGYAEPWIVAPGDTVAIKVRCLHENVHNNRHRH